jgi:hypothetical protein
MTRIIKRVYTVAILLTLLSSVMVGSARALVLAPGVELSMVFCYDITGSWSSSDEYASIPAEIVEYNRTETFEVRISNVTGSNVKLFWAIYFMNESYFGDYGLVDVDTGDGYGSFVQIIAGNLNEGNLIHPLGSDEITINQTVIKSYESGNRETNRILLEYYNATTGATERDDLYFDKALGILVESHETVSYSDGDSTTTTTVSWEIKSSNAWVIPEFPSVVILPLLMAVTMVAAIAYKKKQLGVGKTLIPSSMFANA